MRNYIVGILLLFLVIVGVQGAYAQARDIPAEIDVMQEIAAEILSGDAQAVHAKLSDQMREQLPVEAIASIGEELQANGGELTEWTNAREEDGALHADMVMSQAVYHVKMLLTADGEIGGIWFTPVENDVVQETAYVPKVEIQMTPVGENMPLGTEITLTAVIHHAPEGATFQYQWQNDASGAFADVPGATEQTYTFTVDEAYGEGHNWRVITEME